MVVGLLLAAGSALNILLKRCQIGSSPLELDADNLLRCRVVVTLRGIPSSVKTEDTPATRALIEYTGVDACVDVASDCYGMLGSARIVKSERRNSVAPADVSRNSSAVKITRCVIVAVKNTP